MLYIYIYSLTFTNFIFHTAGTWFHRRATSFVQLAAVYVGGPYYKALHYANSSRISVRRDRYPFVPFYPLLSSALSSSSPKRKRARAPRLKARNPWLVRSARPPSFLPPFSSRKRYDLLANFWSIMFPFVSFPPWDSILWFSESLSAPTSAKAHYVRWRDGCIYGGLITFHTHRNGKCSYL